MHAILSVFHFSLGCICIEVFCPWTLLLRCNLFAEYRRKYYEKISCENIERQKFVNVFSASLLRFFTVVNNIWSWTALKIISWKNPVIRSVWYYRIKDNSNFKHLIKSFLILKVLNFPIFKVYILPFILTKTVILEPFLYVIRAAF